MKVATMLCVAAAAAVAEANQMVLLGDSWGTEGRAGFYETLKAKGSTIQAVDICVGGTTTNNWVSSHYVSKMKAALNESTEVVWVTLMGNDAKDKLPVCALEGGSTDKCIDRLLSEIVPRLETIIQQVHTLSPKARVVGFGYDIMGFGKDNGPCDLIPVALMPHCKGNTTCFNEHFLRIQGVWSDLQAKYDYVDALNLLGSIQHAAGNPKASIGHPDLSTFSPAEYMRSNCIHANDKGFRVVFSNMYDMYLHRFNH